jgi:hypothetical protein
MTPGGKIKSFCKIIILAVLILQIFSSGFAFAQNVPPKSQDDCPDNTEFVPGRAASGVTDAVPAVCKPVNPSGEEGNNWVGRGFVWALGQFVNTTFLSTVGPILLLVSGSILGFAGLAFNQAIEFSILNMSSHVGGLEAIDVGWALFRDMINMGLIFILLYISIGTILGLGGFASKKTIGNVILVALFINFSLFATRLIIDVSNVFAVGMYNNIQNSQNIDSTATSETSRGTGDTQESFKTSNVGLSGAIMRPLVLTFVYNPTVNDGTTASLASALWGPIRGAVGGVSNIIADPWKIFVTTIMGSVMMLIAAFVFFAGAIMFLTRYVVLLFVMVASPLAFGSLAFPGGKKFFDQWLGYLTNYAFFAPVYLFLLYFVAYFLNNSNIIKAGDNFSIIINFVIAMIMMLTALIASSKFGIAGSKFATKMAGAATFGLAGWVGRSTVGRLGHTLAESKDVRDLQASDNVFRRMSGNVLKFSGEAASKGSFDLRASPLKNAGDIGKQLGSAEGKGGYKKILDDAKKPIIEQGKFVGGLSPQEKARKEQLELQQASTKENLNKFKTEDAEFLRYKAEIEALQKKRKVAESEVYLSEGDKQAKLKVHDDEIADKTKKQDEYFKRSNIYQENDELSKEIENLKGVAKNRRESLGNRIANKPSLWSKISGTADAQREAGREIAAKDFDEKQKKEKERKDVLKAIAEEAEKGKGAKPTPESAPKPEAPKT